MKFQPISDFNPIINRSERTQQVHLLVPLLAKDEGCVWFLNRLGCPCTLDEARSARIFHLCYPLRDVFTHEYNRCRGKPHLEDQLIAYYNRIFGLTALSTDAAWRTRPDGPIRHPAAPGRKGWHREFLIDRVSPEEVEVLLTVRQWLNTEADAMLLLARHVVIIECKYRSGLRRDQYERQIQMGQMLSECLCRDFFFGLVVDNPRNLQRSRIREPYVTWDAIQAQLSPGE